MGLILHIIYFEMRSELISRHFFKKSVMTTKLSLEGKIGNAFCTEIESEILILARFIETQLTDKIRFTAIIYNIIQYKFNVHP